ncbi:MAG: CehA/McbA family metallohydrolase [Gemmataceae bacterium]
MLDVRHFLAVVLAATPAGPLAAADWPAVKAVEAQPLLAQVKRLDQALGFLGQPLPEATRAGLAALRAKDGEAAVARAQALLDPHCLAAVEVGEKGVARVIPAGRKLELVEQGWRVYLVKVINAPGATGQLRVDSPNARPVPNSPKGDVPNRWMSLLPYTAQPMLPGLSGLKLEYTLVQVYSRDAGEKAGDVSFRVEGGKGLKAGAGPVVREWKFADGTDGWKAEKNCRLRAVDGKLRVTVTDEDPYFTTGVSAKKGKFVLRFWAAFEKPGIGQMFWWSKERPQPDGVRSANFPFQPGRGQEYEVRFDCTDDELRGVRLDPGNDPTTATFEWITLSYETDPAVNDAAARLRFTAKPSVPVTFRVAEFDGKPTTAAFLIRDREGRVYPAPSKRLAPDFFFQPQVYRATGETVRLPAGAYTVHCSRGPESIPETKELVVADRPAELRYAVSRWIDPAKGGWYSGDHHIHAAGCLHYESPTEGVEPEHMMRHLVGEDVKVGCCLTWGPCFDYQKRFFTGKPADVSRLPHLLRYDVEVSGFGSHASGHLNLLNLKEQIPPGGTSKHHWPTLGMNTLRWAKRQGAVCGPAHSGNGLTRFVGRVGGAEDGPGGLPHYNVPAYDGIGANEFIVDVTHEVPGPAGKPVPAVDFISTMNTPREAEWTMWYHVLNCGFRVRASGETDFPCMTGDRVGVGRVYAKVEGELTFEKWVRSVADGRSYVSDGSTHLMDLTATGESGEQRLGTGGSEVRLSKPGKVALTVRAAARYPGRKSVPVELVVNGLPVEERDLACDGTARELTFAADVAASSWVAVRVVPTGHTNPFFVVVGGKPIRASRGSAEWCRAGVEQCWKTKRDTYRKEEQGQARADYDHARRAYDRLIREAAK